MVAEPAADALLRLSRVSKRYQTGVEEVIACDDVSVEMLAGEVVWLRGASGSGKTTLIKVAAGIVAPDCGEVHVADKALDAGGAGAAARRRLTEIGIVFQDDLLIEEFTAHENVRLPLEAGHWRGDWDREAEDKLTLVGLGDLAGRRPTEMSGGQRQRVGIARALAGGKRLLLADEPTGSLDSRTSCSIFELFADLARRGVGVLVASHDPIFGAYAVRTWDIVDGRVDERAGGAR